MGVYPINPERVDLLTIEERAERFLLPGELSIKDIGELWLKDDHERYSFYADIITECKAGTLEYAGDIENWQLKTDLFKNIESLDFDSGKVEEWQNNFINQAEEDYFRVVNPPDILIHRDNLEAFLRRIDHWPIKNCLLANWWADEHATETNGSKSVKNETDGQANPITDDWSNDPNLTKLEKQHKAILKVIASNSFNPMAIPDRGKTTIRQICEADYQSFFDCDNSFDEAWRRGREKNLFRMENHASFAKRGKK